MGQWGRVSLPSSATLGSVLLFRLKGYSKITGSRESGEWWWSWKNWNHCSSKLQTMIKYANVWFYLLLNLLTPVKYEVEDNGCKTDRYFCTIYIWSQSSLPLDQEPKRINEVLSIYKDNENIQNCWNKFIFKKMGLKISVLGHVLTFLLIVGSWRGTYFLLTSSCITTTIEFSCTLLWSLCYLPTHVSLSD